MDVYRKFIPKYTRMDQLLYELVKEYKGYDISKLHEDQIESFNEHINAVLDPKLLQIPKPGLRYSRREQLQNELVKHLNRSEVPMCLAVVRFPSTPLDPGADVSQRRGEPATRLVDLRSSNSRETP